MSKVKAAVFASGTGSNFTAIIEANVPCEIAVLVCNQAGAKVIEKAKAYGIEVLLIDASEYATRLEFETVILERLQELKVEWIFLAGYMRLMGPIMLEAYPDRILNIHPSYLPDFPGLDAIGDVLRAGVDETGVTVHFIDAGMDTGPIIAQQKVPVYTEDTRETLAARIHVLEHEMYPNVITKLLES